MPDLILRFVNIDFIGDIHGNFSKLKNLLISLDYEWFDDQKIFNHSDNRRICVLGDFINVGLENEKVLDLLYNMHLKNQAYIIVGNHEYFLYLLYIKTLHNKNLFWNHLRMNYFTIYQEFINNNEKLFFYLDWIGTLPIFLEFNDVKVVHAFWEDEIIEKLKNINNVKAIIENAKTNIYLRENINRALVGIIHKYVAKDNEKPFFFRYRWWDYDKNLPLQNMFIHKTAKLPINELEKIDKKMLNLKIGNNIIFFGHYNLQGYPHLTHSLRCCLDFGGAKGGFLTAYRWNGENVLKESNLVWI